MYAIRSYYEMKVVPYLVVSSCFIVSIRTGFVFRYFNVKGSPFFELSFKPDFPGKILYDIFYYSQAIV